MRVLIVSCYRKNREGKFLFKAFVKLIKNVKTPTLPLFSFNRLSLSREVFSLMLKPSATLETVKMYRIFFMSKTHNIAKPTPQRCSIESRRYSLLEIKTFSPGIQPWRRSMFFSGCA